ncbi:MAG: hypothetical protein ACK48V_09180 [Crocinitomicaceae bacterium]
MKYLKPNTLLIILSLFTRTIFCQVIDNQLGKGFEQFPVFNVKYIKQKRIKEIKATFFTKKTGDIMRESPKHTVVEFDLLGRLVLNKEVSKSGAYTDVNHVEYVYNVKGLVSKERKKIGSNWKVTDYFYDTTGQVIKEEYHLETVLFSDDGYSIEDTLLDYETSRYKQYPNQKKRIVYNSYGSPYLDIIYYYNNANQIIEIGKKLKMTSEINETKLFYNNKNQIDSLVFFSSLTPDETESVYFTYDKQGNILDKKLYVNNKLIYRIEFVYNEKTGMLSSILKQEISTNFLSIIRFETKYFD